jgi:hypothetical protein
MHLRFAAQLLVALPLCTPLPAFAFKEEEHCQVSNQGLRMAIAFYRDCQRASSSAPQCKALDEGDLLKLERFAGVPQPGTKDAESLKENSSCRAWTLPVRGSTRRVPTFGYFVSLVDYMSDPNDMLTLPKIQPDSAEEWSFLDFDRLQSLKESFYREIKFAHHDVNHFQEHALMSFRLWHEHALEVANRYHQARNKHFDDLLYALTLNAFATHFLEDFLAAGHFASPRLGLHDAAAKAYHDTYNGRGHDFSGRQSDWPTATTNGPAAKWLAVYGADIERVRDGVFPVKAFWETFSSTPLRFTGDGSLVYGEKGRVKVDRPDCGCSAAELANSHSRCSLTGLPEHGLPCLDPKGYQYDLVATIVAAAVLDVLCVWPTEPTHLAQEGLHGAQQPYRSTTQQVESRSSFFPTWEPYGRQKGALPSPRGCLLPFGCYPREIDRGLIVATPRYGLILDVSGGFQAVLGANQSSAGGFSAGIVPLWHPHSGWRPGSKLLQLGVGFGYSYIQANQYKAYGPDVSVFFPATSIDFQLRVSGGYRRYSTPIGAFDRGHVALRAEFGYGLVFLGVGPGLEHHYVQGQGLRPALGLTATISLLYPLSPQGSASAQSEFAAAMSKMSP